MTQTLSQIIDTAKEALADSFRDYEYPEDLVHELADNACCINNYNLLQLACEDLTLATEESELGLAFDGRKTAVNAIAANLYERISNELHQYLYELQEREAA